MTDGLEAAGDAVASEWRRFAADTVSMVEVTTTTEALTAAIRGTRDGTDGVSAVAPTPLARELLHALRAAYVAALDAPLDATVVPTLQAIEAVDATISPHWSARFQERLDGPSGVDLIVEIAHDLRSPLTSILFLAETMLRGRSGPLTPLQQRQIALVYAAAFGLNAVASDVVELVRGGSRLIGDAAKPFAISEILESVHDIVGPIAEEKGLTLRLIGPVANHRMGYPGALNRVILNLTTNALKFTAEGGVVVEVAELPERGVVRCTVTDTGRGIPPAAMALLYEPFRRRQQVGDYAFSGSGLGLSICRTLVEAMGGALEVETTAGSGTRFWFDLAMPTADPGMMLS